MYSHSQAPSHTHSHAPTHWATHIHLHALNIHQQVQKQFQTPTETSANYIVPIYYHALIKAKIVKLTTFSLVLYQTQAAKKTPINRNNTENKEGNKMKNIIDNNATINN